MPNPNSLKTKSQILTVKPRSQVLEETQISNCSQIHISTTTDNNQYENIYMKLRHHLSEGNWWPL